MVKKRAVLSGQGKELFFSEAKKGDTPPQPKPAPSKPKPAPPNATPEAAGPGGTDLVARIKVLKKLVGEFKKLVDAGTFKSMRLRDLSAFGSGPRTGKTG
jgi:hypothetical protein